MTRRAIPGLALAAAAILAACASGAAPTGAAPSGGTPGASSPTLDGHTYLSTGIDGADLVPGTQVRLAFADGSLNASGGCNLMGGTYTIDGDRLSATQLAMTEMGCDDARQHQDEWLARFLGGVTFELRGDTLILSDGAVRLTLLDKEVATPDQPLEGTSWLLDGIVSGDAVSSVPGGVTAAIQIAAGRIEVNAGCNTGGGTAQVAADSGSSAPSGTITVSPIGLTKMACQSAAMAVEAAMTTVLDGTVRYAIDADVLTLTAGDHGLTFRATGCSHCRP
ncbi:MAG TPA: META domain-containing protein [Candidatus Limnocylindrales bacterium]